MSTDILAQAAMEAGVTGAALAFRQGDGPIRIACHGLANAAEGRPVGPDALFEIGSITKVMTATVAMQLVADGALTLDDPVRRIVPEFTVRDAGASRAITLRHLLSHASGVDGDHFLHCGEDDKALGHYARSCAVLDQLHGPGQGVSYSNAGYTLIGWILERVSGIPYATLMERRLAALIGGHDVRFERAGTDRPGRVDGHVASPQGPVVVPRHIFPYAQAPSGSRTTATIMDVARFADMHLRGETCAGLTATAIDEMRRLHQRAPDGEWDYAGRGMGWELFGPDLLSPGHDGVTAGQTSFLRTDPASGSLLALATTGPGGRALFASLVRTLFPDFARHWLVAPPPPQPDLPIAPLIGRYLSKVRRISIGQADGTPFLLSEPGDDPSGIVQRATARIVPAAPHILLRLDPGSDEPRPLIFSDFDADGVPHALHAGQRMYRRAPHDHDEGPN